MNNEIKNIGIAMSGGGFRATCFQLGTIDYLNHLDLLQNLKMISTVSGGTFTGASYILSLVNKQKFDDYLVEFYHTLETTDLSKQTLEQLGRGDFGNFSGRRSLITSAAQVYSQTFFSDQNGNPYQMGAILSADIPVEEVIFNSTEFNTGESFRFERSAGSSSYLAKQNCLVKEQAEQVRIADVVAASSCFPGGFEPIAFPTDFVWPDNNIPEMIQQNFPQPLALMDGGVYDNQGLENLMQSDEHSKTDLDLLLISDVAHDPEVLYQMPPAKKPSKLSMDNMSLGMMSWCLLFIAAIGLLSASADIYSMYRETVDKELDNYNILAGSISVLFTATVVSSLLMFRYVVRWKVLPEVPHIGRAAWKDLKRIKLGTFVDMSSLRINTLITMSASIFMKRVRGLVYDRVDNDTEYFNSRCENLIGDLATGTTFADLPDEIQPPQPGGLLARVCDTAASMATTLWWNKDHEQPALVACGQATVCYNLMRFVYNRNHGTIPSAGADRVLWDKLSKDWQAFNQDPYCLLKTRLGDKNLNYPPLK